MRKTWERFQSWSKWKRITTYVITGFFALVILAGILGDAENGSNGETVVAEAEQSEPAQSQPESQTEPESTEPEPEPRPLTPAQTLERIWSDPDDACGFYGFGAPRIERENFEGHHQVMAEDLPAHVEPASAGRTFRYVLNYCADQLETLTAAETADHVYGDGSDWCIAYELAGGADNEDYLRGAFRDSYRSVAVGLIMDGYDPAPANSVFDELRSRCS